MSSQRIDRDALVSADRLEQGYVIILPGIEGRSLLNRWIRRGLLDAGVPYAIEIHDWTYGPVWFLWNTRDHRRHQQQAAVIAGKIVNYRREHPSQPVYLIGHSGGGAMTAFALAVLPDGVKATGGIMIVPGLSPGFDLSAALGRTERGLWNYYSYGDVFLIGLGTTLVGNCDGPHGPGAGMLGFHWRPGESGLPPLHQIRFQWRMLKDFNFGGHLSCVNPRFVRKWLAPIVLGQDAEAPGT